MKLQQTPRQTQRQILTPLIQQSIEVLLLPSLELQTLIDQRLQENPFLEIDETKPAEIDDTSDREMHQRIEHALQSSPVPVSDPFNDDEIIEDRPIGKEISLDEHLQRQLYFEITDTLDLKIGEFIIGNIDEDGFLKVTCEEITEALGITDTQRAEHVLHIVQRLDPTGIASRSLVECLLVQLEEYPDYRGQLAKTIVHKHLADLSHKRYHKIASNLKQPVELVKQAATLISRLDPRPARNFRPVQRHNYIKPDLYIVSDTSQNYQVVMNDESLPPLRISSTYRRMIKKEALSADELRFLREKLKDAVQFLKSIEQRGQTIKLIAEYILHKQEKFFANGHMSLAPLTLREVAKHLDRNESTISRAIKNKYIDTPRGILPLKFFFSQQIRNPRTSASHTSDTSPTSRSIKEEIWHLIADEDKGSPLSDQALQEHFAEQGMKIARRTIAKYRQSLRLPPSHLRKT